MSRSHFRSVLGLLCATSLFAGCDSAVAPPGTPPAAVQIVSGDNQSGSVGVELAQPLAAKVLDAEGRAIPGQIVNFRVTAGGGSVFAGAGQTNDTGLVQERWTLGTSTADSQRVEVRVVNSTTGAPLVLAVFKATALAGPAVALAKTLGDEQAGPLSTALPESLAVTLTDQYNNPVSGDTVAWAVTVGGGSVSPAKVTTNTAGVAKAQWVLGTGLDTTHVATATRAGMSPAVFTSRPTAGGPPARLEIVQGNLQTADPGNTLPESSVVKLLDLFGSPVSGTMVSWTVTGGGGSTTPASATTNGAGLAKTLWTLGPSGSQTLTAGVSGTTLAPVRFRAGLRSSEPVEVRITSPLHASVARPTINVAASCDPGRCTLLQLFAGSRTAAASSEGDTLQAVLSLADYDGQPVVLQVEAHDFLLSQEDDTATVFVELSPALTFVTDLPGEIWEVQANRILYRQDSAGISLLKIRNRATNADTVLMGDAGKFPRDGYSYLTPLGAMFEEGWSSLYEWRNGNLSNLGGAYQGTLLVSGQYAIWRTYPLQLVLRDVLANTNTMVSTSFVTQAYVASNGDVVYSTDHTELFRFRGGITTSLATAPCFLSPVTDGTNVVYVRADALCQGGQVYLYDASGDIALTSDRDYRSGYAVNNGWVTYTEFDGVGVPQIWTRSPAGETRQVPAVTFAGASEKRLERLGPAGEVVFLVGGTGVGWRRFLARPDGSTPVAISWSLGRPYWINGELFLAIGRSLFKVQ